MTAPSITSSGSSLASDSTIITASCVPATTRSSVLSAISSSIGLSTYSPPIKPTRAAPIGPEERHAGEGERRGGRDQRHDVRVVLHVVREHGGDDLRLVLEALDEQRADRPVDQARGQRLLLGGAALALEKAAGDLAGGEGLLLVVDGQGEEVDAGLGVLGGDGGGEHDGLAIVGETAPSAWRAMRPVSSVRLRPPHSISTVCDMQHDVSSHTRRDRLRPSGPPGGEGTGHMREGSTGARR